MRDQGLKVIGESARSNVRRRSDRLNNCGIVALVVASSSGSATWIDEGGDEGSDEDNE